MIPLTNKEIKQMKCQDTYYRSALYRAGRFFALHGVISALLLPLTVQVISSQYGDLRLPIILSMSGRIMTLEDMPFRDEAFLISLLFLANLLGFISVIKGSVPGLGFYLIVRIVEFFVSWCWVVSADAGYIKSHYLPQWLLILYCSPAFFFNTISAFVVINLLQLLLKNKSE